MYVCMYVFMHAYIYLCMYVCMHLGVYVCIYKLMYVRKYLSIYVCDTFKNEYISYYSFGLAFES